MGLFQKIFIGFLATSQISPLCPVSLIWPSICPFHFSLLMIIFRLTALKQDNVIITQGFDLSHSRYLPNDICLFHHIFFPFRHANKLSDWQMQRQGVFSLLCIQNENDVSKKAVDLLTQVLGLKQIKLHKLPRCFLDKFDSLIPTY